MMASFNYDDNMMMRTQIQFEEETYKALQSAAKELKSSISEVVRQSVKHHLKAATTASNWKRALAAAGHFHSGHKDISVNHDLYLSDEW